VLDEIDCDRNREARLDSMLPQAENINTFDYIIQVIAIL
jgi:hypothetical protein